MESVPNKFDTQHQNRSIITVITTALDGNSVQLHPYDYHVENFSSFQNGTRAGIVMAICSLDHFISQNNLDKKQTVAFQAICTYFMLTFLMDPSLDITQVEHENFKQMLQSRGATQQLLMCVTRPGGSG